MRKRGDDGLWNQENDTFIFGGKKKTAFQRHENVHQLSQERKKNGPRPHSLAAVRRKGKGRDPLAFHMKKT